MWSTRPPATGQQMYASREDTSEELRPHRESSLLCSVSTQTCLFELRSKQPWASQQAQKQVSCDWGQGFPLLHRELLYRPDLKEQPQMQSQWYALSVLPRKWNTSRTSHRRIPRISILNSHTSALLSSSLKRRRFHKHSDSFYLLQ